MPLNPEPWMTSAGPLDGVVTLTAIPEGDGRTLVEAAWLDGGGTSRSTCSVECESYEAARALAHAAAGALAEGRAPDLERD